jgi:oxygen-independent coproporphyrinogen III oxidase
MCHGFVDAAGIEEKHGVQFDSYFRKELEQLDVLREDGLVDLTSGRIALTPVGRLLMRNVAMTFDAYLGAGDRPLMSRAI